MGLPVEIHVGTQQNTPGQNKVHLNAQIGRCLGLRFLLGVYIIDPEQGDISIVTIALGVIWYSSKTKQLAAVLMEMGA